MIAGVTVPDKPTEPDNCCMSGCINCVWELFNDDLKHWNDKRKEAALKLKQKGGRWPEDFHAPVKYLDRGNLPKSLANADVSEENEKPDLDVWGDVPVSIKVFVETEKKMKARRKEELLRQVHQLQHLKILDIYCIYITVSNLIVSLISLFIYLYVYA